VANWPAISNRPSSTGAKKPKEHPATYLLAGGIVLSDPMPADAPVAGGLAIPDGVPVSAGGVVVLVGGAIDGEVDGVVAGGLMGAGVAVSSIFLPQAPSISSAESATAVAAGLKWTEFMEIPYKNGWKETHSILQST